MNNTKDVKAFYESNIIDRLHKALQMIENEGFNRDTYCELRFLQNTLTEMNAAEHFYNAWNEEGDQAQRRKGA
jgi:hypothetical protein